MNEIVRVLTIVLHVIRIFVAVVTTMTVSYSYRYFLFTNITFVYNEAFRDRGEGFSVFSDIAVAANVVLRDFPDIASRILIIDLDGKVVKKRKEHCTPF